MANTKRNPGKFDCYDRAAPDEPVFTLLGRDHNAPGVVRVWAGARMADIDGGRAPESDREKVNEALRVADQMEQYRKGVKKTPPILKKIKQHEKENGKPLPSSTVVDAALEIANERAKQINEKGLPGIPTG